MEAAVAADATTRRQTTFRVSTRTRRTSRLHRSHASKDAFKDRQKKQMSMAARVAENATRAREKLQPFADARAPTYHLLKGVMFGSFVDLAIIFRIPICHPFYRPIIDIGGPEQVRFLLAVAEFDKDHNGIVDEDELIQYEKVADEMIANALTFSGNLAVVSALMLGLSHSVVRGRPVPIQASEYTIEYFGYESTDFLLWAAYMLDAVAEGAAFFTLCCSIFCRNSLSNVLPTREANITMLRVTKTLGCQSVGIMVMLWSFLLSSFPAVFLGHPDRG